MSDPIKDYERALAVDYASRLVRLTVRAYHFLRHPEDAESKAKLAQLVNEETAHLARFGWDPIPAEVAEPEPGQAGAIK